jgi:hypothetical protein
MSDIDKMKQSIEESLAGLGFPVKFGMDEDLRRLAKGPPLKMKELRALPDDSAVYVTYKEPKDEGRYRIRQAMRISRYEEHEGGWNLDDGSSFGADFTPVDDSDEAECFDEANGQGEMYLFHAVKKPERRMVAKKRGKNGAPRSSR